MPIIRITEYTAQCNECGKRFKLNENSPWSWRGSSKVGIIKKLRENFWQVRTIPETGRTVAWIVYCPDHKEAS